MRITSDGDQFSLHKGNSFSTLWELLQFYMENPGLLKQTNRDTLELKHPVYCQGGVKERLVYYNPMVKLRGPHINDVIFKLRKESDVSVPQALNLISKLGTSCRDIS